MLSNISKHIIQELQKNKSIHKNMISPPYTDEILKLIDHAYQEAGNVKMVTHVSTISKLPSINCSSNVKEDFKLLKYHYTFICYLPNLVLYIHFYTKQHKSLINYAKRIVTMILFFLRFPSSKCIGSEMTIHLLFTPTLKYKPFNEVIGPKHLNSGYTYRCSPNSDICIYRYEEWFKVLLHECFHYFGLDETLDNHELNMKIKKMFNSINSDINIPETYCETWARILNVYFTCYFIDKKKYKYNVKHLMHYEILFARFQMDKLLETMGMKYIDIFSKNNYHEETNAFAYIILTYLLLYKYDVFIEWCNKYNPTLLRVGNHSITELIKPHPIPDMNLHHPKYSHYMKENSRMTSIELE